MKEDKVWEVLGIAPGSDEETIRNAYREKLVGTNPEDDPEGFKLLREAYETAVSMLKNTDEKPAEDEKEKTPAELLVGKAEEIYYDIFRRNKPSEWEEFFSDPLIEGLDTIDEVRRAFLVYTMSHFVYAPEMWKEFDRVFRLLDEEKTLIEEFPPDFISFVKERITEGDYFTYNDMLPGDSDLATFIREYPLQAEGSYEEEELACSHDVYIRNVSGFLPIYSTIDSKYSSDEEKDNLKKEFAERLYVVRKYDIFHPLEGIGLMLYYYVTGDHEKALSIAERYLDPASDFVPDKFSLSYAAHILLADALRNGIKDEGKLDELAEKLQEISRDNPKFQMAHFALSEYFYLKGDHVKSSEHILNASEYNESSVEIDEFIDKNDIELRKFYKDKIESGEASDNDKIELGWCMLRDENIPNEEITAMLDEIEPTPDIEYNYCNLYARCCVKSEDYKKADKYVRRWHELVMETYERSQKEGTDDFTAEEKKRLARIGYSYYLMALCNNEAGRMDEAEEAYKQAAAFSESRNDKIIFRKILGEHYHKVGKYSEAFDLWNEILDMEPRFTYGYMMRQEAAFKTKRAQQVINDYNDIISFAPDYVMAYVYAAKVFRIYDQSEDFIKVFEKAEENNAVCQQLLFEKAKFLKEEEKYDDAEQIFAFLENELIEDKTKSKDGEADGDDKSNDEEQDNNDQDDDTAGNIETEALLYAEYGICLYDHAKKMSNMDKAASETVEEGQPDYEKICKDCLAKAWECIDKGLKADPKSIYVHWLITDLLEFEDKDVEDEYKKMLELFPDESSVNYEYGRYLDRKDREDDAAEQYKETIKKDPGHQDAYGNLTDYYINRYGDTEDEEDYKKAIDYIERQIVNCDDSYFRIKQALAYIEGYEFEKALESAELAVRQEPDNVFAYNAKGYALMMLDRMEEAEEVFKTGLSYMKTPRRTALQNNLVLCLERQRKFKEAFEVYSKFCEDCKLDAVENKERKAKLLKRMGDFEAAEEVYGKLYEEHVEKYLGCNKDKASKVERFMLNKLVTAYDCLGNNRDDLTDIQLTMMDLYVVSGNKKRFNVLSKDIRKYIDLEFGKRNIAVFLNSVMSNDNVRDAAMDRMCAMNMVGMQMLYVSRDYPLAEKCFTMVIKIMERFHEIDGKYGNPNWVATTYMRFAESCYRNKHISAAKKAAEKAMKLFRDGEKDESKYTAYHNFRPKRLEQMAKLYFFMGDRDKAFRLLEEMRECGICSDCHERKCYESYLTLAKLYELSDNNILALENYKKAHEINPDDAEVENAIAVLEK